MQKPFGSRIRRKNDRYSVEDSNDIISEFGYMIVSEDMRENGNWGDPIVDIGGFDLLHVRCFPAAQSYVLIDRCACDIDVGDQPKNTFIKIGKEGFPEINVAVPSKFTAIALYSLTMNDQYMKPDVIKALKRFKDLYITIPNDRLEAYGLYSEAFHGNLDCIWTRRSDHLKLMHYWN